MMYEVFKFELKYRLKRPETYLFFSFLFLFSLVGVEFVFQGVELGLVKKNAPVVVAKTMGAITGLSMMIASMIMGVPIIRDFQYNMESIMFVNPMTKTSYLIGRFLGSFLILGIIFSGVLFGMMLGGFMPWVNASEYLGFEFTNYFQPFIWVALPIVFFGAALFFITGALSRNMMLVYSQGIFIFVLFLLTKQIPNETIQAVFDPFSLTTLTDSTKNWSIFEKNYSLIPFSGVMLYNKIFWLAFGLVILVFGVRKMNLSVIANQSRKHKQKPLRSSKELRNIKELTTLQNLEFNFKASIVQLVNSSLFYVKYILKQASFWAIAGCSLLIILINSVNLGTSYGVNSYPKTYLIIEELQEMSIYFFVIILVFYSAELVWKEREVQLNLISDSTPASSFVLLLGKLTALLIIYTILIFTLILTGVFFQALNGYFEFDLLVYFQGFFLEVFPFLMLYTIVSFVFQTLFSSKYLGVLATLVFGILNMALFVFGFDHVLLNFGGNTIGVYSEMNGYGHYLKPYLLIKMYWICVGGVLFVLASILYQRGVLEKISKRIKTGFLQIDKRTKLFLRALFISLIGIGSFVYYNTHVLNKHWTNNEEMEYRVDYERSLKKLEYRNQPKIIDIELEVDLFPSDRTYFAKGSYSLINTKAEAISEIHVQKLIDQYVHLNIISFDRPYVVDDQHGKFDFIMYKLEDPLVEGDTLKMYFEQEFVPIGFESSNSSPEIVENGLFFNNSVFPSFGYNKKYEIRDEEDRIKYGLEERKDIESIDHEIELHNARNGSDSDGILLDMVISTEMDQKAITSGELIGKWTENNRQFFHYKSEQPIINFYSIVSADYLLIKDSVALTQDSIDKSVDLEIYYHKGHEYNLDRMMESMKYSLDYYNENFSPFQYKSMRIMEFPRYRKFAQSFPNAIPFSEGMGFIMDINDEEDVDMVYYITAHETAHQWWGLQVEAANVEGRSFILETLAQYSAMMVFKKKYSKENMHQFLQLQYEDYLDGQKRSVHEEKPLALVGNEDYIYYSKGALNMYILQETIGEKQVNLALRNFLNDWRTNNNPNKSNRYSTSKDLLNYLKEACPTNQEYMIPALFEEVNCEDFGW